MNINPIRIPEDVQNSLIHLFLTENATPSQTSVNINPDVLGSQAGIQSLMY